MANPNNTIPFPQASPNLVKPQLSLAKGADEEQDDDNTKIHIQHPDGSITVNIGGDDHEDDDGPEDDDFSHNLALSMEPSELSQIGTSLLEGIDRDEQSRKDWLDTRALGISLLGLKLEKPRSDAGTSSAPLEGMSTVRHPLLLEATVSFQATARGELLPASGPVKVRNDSPPQPAQVEQGTSASKELAESLQGNDELAQALEIDMNHYLTVTATEYVPDTDRMLFYVGFGGDGFKKVYNCPLRRRPVSESVDAEDLIVSNAATDMHNAGRVTQRIKMRPSILRRMQILGAYRDVDLNPPAASQNNPVDKKKEEISGQSTAYLLPKDRDYEVYECYCELDLDQFAPKGFKGKGLPLPYRVTIEKDSRQVLDVRRNWKEDDDQCLAKTFFVQFPFIRGLGFYGLGYIHLLGNSTVALTAAWREMLDAGMFANFPGFLIAKGATRQNTSNMRVSAGSGVPVDIGSQQNIRDAIMPLPYKDVGQAFNAFIQHIEEASQRLASTANIGVGEGKQDAPVGTTLALIEQASKVIDSAHKRLHAAQAEEFKLLKERFREDPEAFWRHNKNPTVQWKKDQFMEALNNCELVPVADPNNPTSLHRMAKAMAIKELQKANQSLYDPIAVDMRIMKIAQIDPSGLFRPTPAPPPPDPRMEAIQQKAAAQDKQSQIQLMETKIKAATQAAAINDKAQDRQSRERIEQMKIQLEQMKIEEERIIHGLQAQQDAQKASQEIQLTAASKAHELAMESASHNQDLQHQHASKQLDMAHDHMMREHERRGGLIENQHQIERDRELHGAQMERDRQKHEMDMQHAKEMHAAKLEAARALAKVKKPATKKKD